jgi:DNA-binding LacI/PurR family transcriptional regulator
LNTFRVLEGNQRVDGGDAAVRALLAQPNRATALMCSNDLTAIGAMMTLEAAGLHVPEDISVVGSDDIYFAQFTRPPLTTVRLSRDVLAKLAFEALEKMIRSKRRQGTEYVLNTELVVRQSTSRAPRSDTHAPASLGYQPAAPSA